MAHHIYHTEGFVLEGRNIGEANKYYQLFTKELGMIDATAQAVREVKSKLRFSLLDFSACTFSLVRGKNGWKITSAISTHNLYDLLKEDKSKLLLVGHVFSLLKRLLRGEEKNEALFDLVSRGLTYFAGTELNKEEIQNFECVLVLGILHLLGYVGQKDELEPFLNTPEWSKELLDLIQPLRHKALLEINRSLKESQL